MPNLPENFRVNELGNTWLTDELNHVIWIDIPNTKQRLEIAITPDNYPGLSIALLEPEKSTDQHLANHIHQHCNGWNVRKCNIDGVNINNLTITDPS